MKTVVVLTTYLGPVSYYSALAGAERILVEQCDHYHKQTYRNRCRILAANGPIDLVIPVVKHSGHKTPLRDVQIDYTTRWQSNHWRSILSAYNSSPFLEYYIDEFYRFYHQSWKYLIDYNSEIGQVVFGILDWDKRLERTIEYEHRWPEQIDDLRDCFSPKQQRLSELIGQPKTYTQTFSEKMPFVPDLSIIDLIFNTGPLAKTYL